VKASTTGALGSDSKRTKGVMRSQSSRCPTKATCSAVGVTVCTSRCLREYSPWHQPPSPAFTMPDLSRLRRLARRATLQARHVSRSAGGFCRPIETPSGRERCQARKERRRRLSAVGRYPSFECKSDKAMTVQCFSKPRHPLCTNIRDRPILGFCRPVTGTSGNYVSNVLILSSVEATGSFREYLR
jgi:hypothetical protein